MRPASIPPANTTAAARSSTRRLLAISGAVVVLAGVGFAFGARADVGDFIIENIIAPIIMLLINFVGNILLTCVNILISIAKYNGFVTSTPVANGWIIVRDVTNMFFILVLLVLAFGTMLGVETYSYKGKRLPQLLIMAVVINFSRTICGLLIDLGQVVMLTFVNGFAAAAGGNFVEALKINDLLEPGERRGGVTGFAIVVALLLALAIVTISLGVIIIMISVLIIRIIYLWLLVILSPLAFFMKAVPGGKASGYYAEWWSMFTANIVTGPILAFFLWLALVSVAAGGIDDGFAPPLEGEATDDAVSKAMQGVNIQGYIISIALLLGGVMMAQKAGGAGVGIGKSIATGAGKAAARGIKKVSGAAWDKTGGKVVDKAKEVALTAGTYVPGLKTVSGRALGAQRAEKAAKTAEASKFISQLKPEEAARYTKGFAITAEQKAIKKEALRSTLKDKGAKPMDDAGRKNFRSMMTDFEKLGKDTSDKSVVGDLKDLYKQRPDAIIDKSETDPTKIGQQQEAYKNTLKNMSVGEIGKLSPDSLRGDAGKMLMSQMSPDKLIKAMDATDNDDVKKQIAQFGGLNETEVKGIAGMKQSDMVAKFRGKFESAQDAGKRERPDLIVDKDEQKKYLADRINANGGDVGLDPGLVTTSVMGAIAELKNGGLKVNMPSSFKLDTQQLVNNRELAGQIAMALGDKVGKQEKAIAEALRTGLKQSTTATADQKLAGGLQPSDIFKSYDKKRGSFGDPREKDAFEAAVRKNPNVVGGMSAQTMSDRAGLNETSIAIYAGVPDMAGKLSAMAKEGKTDQVMGAVQAAKGIAGMNVIDEIEKYKQSAAFKAMSPAGQSTAEDEKRDDLMDAKSNAEAVLKQWKDKNTTLGAASRDIRFNVTPKVIGGAALVAAAPGAVVTGAAIAGLAMGVKKLNDKRNELGINYETAKRIASDAARGAVTATGRAGRTLSRTVQK